MPVPDRHDCEQFSQQVFDRDEVVCIRCGRVLKESSVIDVHVAEAESRAMNSIDHNAGNALLNSETEGMDYCSPGNKGLAYKYNGFGKDFQGKKVKTKLNDAYRSGCIAGGKEMILKVDPLTGEATLKFDMYNKPYLRMVKERAYSELTRYGLNTVEQTIIARECKRIVSQFFFGEMLEFAWRAAALNAGVLKEKDAKQVERELYELTESIRVRVLSHCDKVLAEQLKGATDPLAAK